MKKFALLIYYFLEQKVIEISKCLLVIIAIFIFSCIIFSIPVLINYLILPDLSFAVNAASLTIAFSIMFITISFVPIIFLMMIYEWIVDNYYKAKRRVREYEIKNRICE